MQMFGPHLSGASTAAFATPSAHITVFMKKKSSCQRVFVLHLFKSFKLPMPEKVRQERELRLCQDIHVWDP